MGEPQPKGSVPPTYSSVSVLLSSGLTALLSKRPVPVSWINHLDQAVLAKAFQGELVPQDSNDEPASILLVRMLAERQTATAQRRKSG
jgi:hypothetical protein